VLLAAVALLACAVRYRLLDVPLERDEGGFAYIGQLILDGIPPYAEAYDYKPPGLYLLYASFILLFGASPAGIHAGLLLASLGSMALVFLLARRWSDAAGGVAAAFILQVLLVSPPVLGFAAHATHFVVFWALAGWLILDVALDRRSRGGCLAAGAALGCALLMKQPGVTFLLAAAALPFTDRAGRGRDEGASAGVAGERGGLTLAFAASGLVVAGALLPMAAAAIWLSAASALDDALYWVVTYPSLVASGAGVTGLVPRIARNWIEASGSFMPLWIAGAACAALLLAAKARTGLPRARRVRFALFCAASVAALIAGYETRPHYFILIIPALALASGLTLARAAGTARAPWRRRLVMLVPAALAAVGVAYERPYFFSARPDEISRSIYAPNQFADAGEIASFIRGAAAGDDRVAVLGSEPEILFLSGRRSATRQIFTNFFREGHGMGAEMEAGMIRELDSARPAVIVVVNQGFSWGAKPRKDWPVMRWAAEYTALHCELAGTVTPVSADSSRFLWGAEARADPGADAAPVVIYRRIRDDRAPTPPR
jgi:4-amino-4-deoxy-L-arabinose transferase-like glycosyltransferase